MNEVEARGTHRSEHMQIDPERGRRLSGDILGMVLLVVAAVIVSWPLWNAGDSPPGIDIFGHLFKPWYLTEVLRQEGFVPQWLNGWYNGFHLLQYYPPLSYLLLSGLTILLGNIFKAYVVFVGMSFAASGLAAFRLARHWLPTWSAVLAALAYMFAPYNLMVVFWEGNLPRTLAMVFIPVVIYQVIRLLERPDWRTGLLTAASLFALVLSHHMPALAMLILLVPFIFVYASLKRLPFSHIVLAGIWLSAGLLISSIWLIPAVTHFDLDRVPNLNSLPERVGQYSVGLDLLDPRTRLDRNAYISLAVAAFAILGFFRSKQKALRWAAAVGVGVGIFFALGKNNPLFEWLPILQYWFPERFLQVVVLFLALLVGGSIASFEKGWKRTAVGVIALVMLTVDFLPNFTLRLVTTVEQDKRESVALLSEWLSTQENSGRLLIQAPINWETAFTPYSVGGKEQNYGWSPEGSAVSLSATEINSSLREGNTIYPQRLFDLWDTRYVVLDPLIADQDRFADELVSRGWGEAEINVPWRVLASEQPSQRYMVQASPVLAIGRGAAITSRMFPGVAQGTSERVDDYSFDYLRQFEGVLFYDFQVEDEERFEALLIRLMDAGIKVWVDMQFQDDLNLFGVQSNFAEVSGAGSFHLSGSSDAGLPLESINNDPAFRGFYPLDNEADILGELRIEGSLQSFPMILPKTVGEGEVVFIGMSLTSLATTFQDPVGIALISSLLGQNAGEFIQAAALPVEQAQMGTQSLHLETEVGEETSVLISLTYTPHWRAYIDGQAVPLYNHEDLCMLWIPTGEHEIDLRFGASPGQMVGFVVTAIGVLFIVGLRWLDPAWLQRRLERIWEAIIDW